MNYAIRVVRLFFSLMLIAISLYFISDYISFILDDKVNYIVIEGFLPTWATFGMFLLGCSALTMSIVSEGSWRTSKFNRLYVASVLINAAVISPMLSSIVLYQLHAKSKGFVVCEELKRSSRRYSSKTYAVTELECQRLVSARLVRKL